jgi:hypothetical protein
MIKHAAHCVIDLLSDAPALRTEIDEFDARFLDIVDGRTVHGFNSFN